MKLVVAVSSATDENMFSMMKCIKTNNSSTISFKSLLKYIPYIVIGRKRERKINGETRRDF